jgi:hypothetical protein
VQADLNVSIGPAETRELVLEYGPGVAGAPAPRGLTVTEDAAAIQVGGLRFGRSGAPLVASASYRGEFIGQGRNSVSIVDDRGSRRDLSHAEGLTCEVVKRGPLSVVLRYTGRIPLEVGYGVSTTVTLEMPASKSWFKLTAEVADAARRVREIAVETPFAFGAHPWLWDFGTDSGTYGVIRTATDAVTLEQLVDPKDGHAWKVDAGVQGALRTYELSAANRARMVAGWGHFYDARSAVAFAIADFGRVPGTHTISFDGRGQAAFRFVPQQPAATHRLTMYQHFVPAPVPVGAATSPPSILNPLVVVLDRDHLRRAAAPARR